MRHLIIGGTEKAGTTSLYQYLNDHPEVIGSFRKETDYFRRSVRSISELSLADYEKHFPEIPGRYLRVEASPGYLVDSQYSAAAIRAVIPETRLLFVLRDPIDRLVSSFTFHAARLYLPKALTFDEYVDLCMRFEQGEISADEAGIGDWFLRVLHAGRYAFHLRYFIDNFRPEQIRITAFDQLGLDLRLYMKALANWVGIDPHFYDTYEFKRSNVTLAPRVRWLHRGALKINRWLDPAFHRYPALKRHGVKLYKAMNGRSAVGPEMHPSTRQRLVEYYRRDLAWLSEFGGDELAIVGSWLEKYRT